MALLCYVTNQLLEDATTHGVAKAKVDSFAKEVELRQSLAGFDHFPPPCLTKKKIFGFNFRLIAAEKHVDEHLVVVLLRLVVRGGNEYTTFLDDPPTWAGRHYDAELNDAKLTAWVANRTREELPPPPPVPSENEQMFLWSSPHAEPGDDIIVCETHEWVESTREARIKDRLIRLPEMIVQAADGPAGEVQILRSAADKNLALLACNLPSVRQCVLLSASYAEPDSQLQLQRAAWTEKLQGADSVKVLRYSRRSYPSILCYDDDMWMAVQKDPQANLALSPEEADILQGSSQSGFPLFINGRAGSGKSTLLQYLFAQSFLRWSCQSSWASAAESRPVYIASSRELLKVARDVVGSLLKANHEYLLATHRVDASVMGSLDGCFQDFMHFLQTALGEGGKGRFPASAYVGYARFRRLWMKRFGREKRAIHEFGPQISWHVIRGFIKGMSVDDLLAKGDYAELPQDERTISRQVYETVYDRVWAAWYEPLCRSGKVWDSQDLVRALLEDERLSASHVAVFCDEAQDFTRLELEAIYRCSLFSGRQLDHLGVKRVPFVFAGDPFQTLNPTGFRWESVRAAFTERILRSLYRSDARGEIPQLNYRELTFNYRSSKRIVHFCNSVQAVRASLFGHRSLRPQHTWQLGTESSAPVFFETGDPQMEAAIREQSDLVLIVPCEEGEEVEYVASDPYLRGFVQADDAGTPRNVLSAARAKGLEFLRVALYGWSAREEARAIGALMRSPDAGNLTIDQRLGLEYFMNNLYVAASRAQRRLFVIDGKESRDALWWFASDEQHLLQVIRALPKQDAWGENTGCLIQGVPESFRDDRDDPSKIAERFEGEGLSKEDSYLLKQASLQYSIAGKATKAHECRALADLFDGRFQDAGGHFQKAGMLERSIDAYWRGRFYKEIAECAKANPEFVRLPRCRVAAYLAAGSQTLRECGSLYEQLLENAKINDALRADLRSDLWRDSLHLALQKAVEGKDKARAELNPDDAGALADLTVQLGARGAQMDVRLIARLLFAARRYEEVLRTLPPDDGSELFRDASALSLINQPSPSPVQYSSAEARVIADYYYRQKDFEAACRYYRQIRDTDRLLECLRQSLQEQKPREASATLVESALLTLVANGEWEPLVSVLTKGQPATAKQGKWDKAASAAVLARVRHDKLILKLVIPALARSDELSSADAKSQQQISEFLARELIKTGYSEWRMDLARAVAGAAIERAGRDLDALQFYESWRDSAPTLAARELAERRWVVCKRRQADREEREGHEKKARSYRQDAAKIMEKYGWTDESVPDTYPDVSAPSEDLALAAQTSKESQLGSEAARTPRDVKPRGEGRGHLGALSYRVIASKGWINIEAEDGLQARVLVHERTVSSDDVAVKVLEGGAVECEEWGLQIRWLSSSAVEFALGQTKCEVSVGAQASEI
jgi:hypothetical protein